MERAFERYKSFEAPEIRRVLDLSVSGLYKDNNVLKCVSCEFQINLPLNTTNEEIRKSHLELFKCPYAKNYRFDYPDSTKRSDYIFMRYIVDINDLGSIPLPFATMELEAEDIRQTSFPKMRFEWNRAQSWISRMVQPPFAQLKLKMIDFITAGFWVSNDLSLRCIFCCLVVEFASIKGPFEAKKLHDEYNPNCAHQSAFGSNYNVPLSLDELAEVKGQFKTTRQQVYNSFYVCNIILRAVDKFPKYRSFYKRFTSFNGVHLTDALKERLARLGVFRHQLHSKASLLYYYSCGAEQDYSKIINCRVTEVIHDYPKGCSDGYCTHRILDLDNEKPVSSPEPCSRCGILPRSFPLTPCNHRPLCRNCIPECKNCPECNVVIFGFVWTSQQQTSEGQDYIPVAHRLQDDDSSDGTSSDTDEVEM